MKYECERACYLCGEDFKGTGKSAEDAHASALRQAVTHCGHSPLFGAYQNRMRRLEPQTVADEVHEALKVLTWLEEA